MVATRTWSHLVLKSAGGNHQQAEHQAGYLVGPATFLLVPLPILLDGLPDDAIGIEDPQSQVDPQPGQGHPPAEIFHRVRRTDGRIVGLHGDVAHELLPVAERKKKELQYQRRRTRVLRLRGFLAIRKQHSWSSEALTKVPKPVVIVGHCGQCRHLRNLLNLTKLAVMPPKSSLPGFATIKNMSGNRRFRIMQFIGPLSGGSRDEQG